MLLSNALHGWSIDLIDSDLRRRFGLCMAGFGCGIADRLVAYATKVPLFLVRDPCPAMLFYCGIRVPILPRAREQRDLVILTKSDAAFSVAQFAPDRVGQVWSARRITAGIATIYVGPSSADRSHHLVYGAANRLARCVGQMHGYVQQRCDPR